MFALIIFILAVLWVGKTDPINKMAAQQAKDLEALKAKYSRTSVPVTPKAKLWL